MNGVLIRTGEVSHKFLIRTAHGYEIVRTSLYTVSGVPFENSHFVLQHANHDVRLYCHYQYRWRSRWCGTVCFKGTNELCSYAQWLYCRGDWSNDVHGRV